MFSFRYTFKVTVCVDFMIKDRIRVKVSVMVRVSFEFRI